MQGNYRTFATNPKGEKATPEEPKKEQKEQFEEEEYQEFHHDETKDGQGQANFSTGRRIFFALGKLFKYSLWSYIVLFCYHFYLVRKKDKPEEALG